MTLTTAVVIGTSTNARDVFDFCRALLGTPDDVRVDEGPCPWRPGWKQLCHPAFAGLPTRLCVYYPDSPAPTQPEAQDNGDDATCDPIRNGWAAIEVELDTSYGYRAANGAECADLNAWLVTELGHWLDRKNLPWKWHMEDPDVWHDGADGVDKLGDAQRGALSSWPQDRS